jgi:CRISPR-associated protein Cmr3
MLLCFDPVDSLFFRDGRPYIKGESEQVNVVSQFPPAPATLVGAVRAATARSLGWSGQGAWNDGIKQKLGDGEALGPLCFRGPVLMRDKEILFPAPANVMYEKIGKTAVLLQPGREQDCDLGKSVRLPAHSTNVQGGDWKPAGTMWLTCSGFEAVLRGESPGAVSLIERKSLWVHEARVGIARNRQTRTTEEGALYSPQHVRLRDGVSLGLWAEGLPPEALDQISQTPQPLGGESRSAWIMAAVGEPAWPALPEKITPHETELNYTVIVLSPLPLVASPAPAQAIPGLPGTLVSACFPRPVMLGGWDSIERRPLPLRPHLAPGSVLFMRADAADTDTVGTLHGACIGLRPAWGYGLIAIGTWS